MKSYRWIVVVALLAGCNYPGQPNEKDKFVAPNKVVDFGKLQRRTGGDRTKKRVRYPLTGIQMYSYSVEVA